MRWYWKWCIRIKPLIFHYGIVILVACFENGLEQQAWLHLTCPGGKNTDESLFPELLEGGIVREVQGESLVGKHGESVVRTEGDIQKVVLTGCDSASRYHDSVSTCWNTSTRVDGFFLLFIKLLSTTGKPMLENSECSSENFEGPLIPRCLTPFLRTHMLVASFSEIYIFQIGLCS